MSRRCVGAREQLKTHPSMTSVMVELNAMQLENAQTNGRSQAEVAFDQIKDAIIRCELRPGAPVTEEELAERFHTGRASVRAALKRLYQQHLVHAVSLRRYVIAPITLREAQEVFEMRMLLEPAAARKAAGKVDLVQLRRLNDLCQVHYQAGDRDSAESFLAANTEFHLTIARAARNDILAETIAAVLDRYQRLNHLSHMLHDRNVEAYHEHSELVEALEAGDADKAEQVMAQQIAAARAFVIDALVSSQSLQEVNIQADGMIHTPELRS
jgi:DNA-binding GntR family transcriptional regulator